MVYTFSVVRQILYVGKENTMCKNLVLKLEYYLKMQSKMVLLIKKLDY